jgi:hypothetical protein
MGIMSFLRNRAGIIIVGAIGFAIVAFLVSDAVQMGGSFMQGNQTEVGEVDGNVHFYSGIQRESRAEHEQFQTADGSE